MTEGGNDEQREGVNEPVLQIRPDRAGREARLAITIVIPCFNEANRLDIDAFVRHARVAPSTRFLFVDDGSTDGTRRLIREACAVEPSFELLAFDENRGKAEAVRAGVLHAGRGQATYVGFWDADLATSLDELPRFRAVLDDQPGLDMVIGSRVNLLGRDVRRNLARHYVSRVFATGVSVALRLPVYDTQCGAKLFRATPSVLDLFRDPFVSRWIFDAELLVRAADRDARGRPLGEIAFELPLVRYRDVPGSKLRVHHLALVLRDGLRIYRSRRAPDQTDQGR